MNLRWQWKCNHCSEQGFAIDRASAYGAGSFHMERHSCGQITVYRRVWGHLLTHATINVVTSNGHTEEWKEAVA